MKYVEVVAESSSGQIIEAIAEKVKAKDFRLGSVGKDGMQQMRMLVDDDDLQSTLDILQNVLGAQITAHIVVLPVEASLPKREEEEKEKEEESATAARELIYKEIEKGAHLDMNYVLLVFLSTVVVVIGLINDNVAVVIGAMVIAPLLGPNLALSLGTALGDMALIRQSIKALLLGIGVAVGVSMIFGLAWPMPIESKEIMSRTEANLDSIFLALASGAAAALSLTTGLSGVLVGVMVAVALLPPAATFGIMLGDGRFSLAMGAGLLLAINVVCVNLGSKIIFLVKRIHPRTWLEQEKAKHAMRRYLLGWVVTLLILVWLMYERGL
ncbi:TIGR00341 family protein [Tepidiphilus sp. J10]|uniref:TIGR00341 family protein n=1 Tax=Tepidiphilus sp. J10 TaxID=2502185 RepID=UPI00115CB015|nr:TIGR00341 family protein [Tepidiphilus sp. J10]